MCVCIYINTIPTKIYECVLVCLLQQPHRCINSEIHGKYTKIKIYMLAKLPREKHILAVLSAILGC